MNKFLESYPKSPEDINVLELIKKNGPIGYFYNNPLEVKFINHHEKNKKNTTIIEDYTISKSNIFVYCITHGLYYTLCYVALHFEDLTRLYLQYEYVHDGEYEKHYDDIFIDFGYMTLSDKVFNKFNESIMSGNENDTILCLITLNNIYKHSTIEHNNLISNILLSLHEIYKSNTYVKIKEYDLEKVFDLFIKNIINLHSYLEVEEIYGMLGITKLNELFLFNCLKELLGISYFSNGKFEPHIIKDKNGKISNIIFWVVREVGSQRSMEIFNMIKENNEIYKILDTIIWAVKNDMF